MKTYVKDRVRIFRQPAFTQFFIAIIILKFVNGIIYITNTWLVVSLSNSLSAVIWSFLAYLLPSFIASPFAGAMVDSMDRKYILGFSIIGMGICFFAFGITLNFIPNVHLYWIYIVYFILGLIGAFFDPSIMAFIREAVSKDDLLYANANLDFGYQIGLMSGMGLAGYMVHFLGFYGSYLFSSGAFFISGLLVLSISNRYLIRDETLPSQSRVVSRFLGRFNKGIKYIISNKNLLVLYMAQMFFILIMETAPVLLAPFAKTILHANAVDFGHIEVMMAIGIFFGSLFLIYLAQKIGFNIIILASSFTLVISLLSFSMVHSIVMGQVVYFFIGLGLSSWSILISFAQELTGPEYQGRVQSIFGSFMLLCLIIIYLVVNLLTDIITIRHLYWVLGSLAIVPIVLVLIFPKYFDGKV